MCLNEYTIFKYPPWICKKFEALKPGSIYVSLNSQAITLSIEKILFALSVGCTKHDNPMLLGLRITTTIAIKLIRLRVSPNCVTSFTGHQLHTEATSMVSLAWEDKRNSWHQNRNQSLAQQCQRTEPSTVCTANIYKVIRSDSIWFNANDSRQANMHQNATLGFKEKLL